MVSVDRFETLLYGIGEAAGYLSVPPSALTTWAYGYELRRTGGRDFRAEPVITAVRPQRRADPAVPFIGLAEAYALAAFRSAGVPMQRIRPAVALSWPGSLGWSTRWRAGGCIPTGRRFFTTTRRSRVTPSRVNPRANWSSFAITSGCSARSWTCTCGGSTSRPTVTLS
jgi:hypothetical protein